MSKPVKDMMIGQILAKIGDRKDFVVLDTSKVDAIAMNDLRLELDKRGIKLLGVKNALARLAFAKSGIGSVDDVLAGPSTLVWGGEDIVGLSREMTEWAKKIDKITIKGGVVDGQGVDSQGVEDISKGPSRLELIGQIVGLVLSPGARLAGALLGPGGTVSGQLKALADKDEGGDAA
ncbi:50S ribosomal protein L10 [Planctomicrobium sp. SH664]|uniref:50S ribosomal protein L10 n=1 Tax=Planctomicrobium sp. SH664 TaxID=3448125 RepID=UPI003F5C3419